MGSGMSSILPGLYLGSFRDARDKVQLESKNITHVVSIHDNAQELDNGKVYLCIKASDSPVENLSTHFTTVNDFIHNARLNGGNVLVHCLAGISRSTTLVVAYVMSVTHYGWKESLSIVRSARQEADPNLGFKKQLRLFETQTLKAERNRLRAKFPQENLPFGDQSVCEEKLTAYRQYLHLGDQLKLEREESQVEQLAEDLLKTGIVETCSDRVSSALPQAELSFIDGEAPLKE